jgi:hypothetical protein
MHLDNVKVQHAKNVETCENCHGIEKRFEYFLHFQIRIGDDWADHEKPHQQDDCEHDIAQTIKISKQDIFCEDADSPGIVVQSSEVEWAEHQRY